MWDNVPILGFFNWIISANSLSPYKKHSQVVGIKARSSFGVEALLWLPHGYPHLALLDDYLLIACSDWICWFLSTLPNCTMGISLQLHTENSFYLIFVWVLSLSPSYQLTACFRGFFKKDVREVRYFRLMFIYMHKNVFFSTLNNWQPWASSVSLFAVPLLPVPSLVPALRPPRDFLFYSLQRKTQDPSAVGKRLHGRGGGTGGGGV